MRREVESQHQYRSDSGLWTLGSIVVLCEVKNGTDSLPSEGRPASSYPFRPKNSLTDVQQGGGWVGGWLGLLCSARATPRLSNRVAGASCSILSVLSSRIFPPSVSARIDRSSELATCAFRSSSSSPSNLPTVQGSLPRWLACCVGAGEFATLSRCASVYYRFVPCTLGGGKLCRLVGRTVPGKTISSSTCMLFNMAALPSTAKTGSPLCWQSTGR
jgi:hypothetical protein